MNSHDQEEPLFRDESQPSWEIARNYAGQLGKISPLFSSCIRAINKADSTLNKIDQQSVEELTASSVDFLIRVSPTLKTVFYFGAETLHPEKLSAQETLTTRSLPLLFTPREVASVLGLTYLYRRTGAHCDAAEWKVLQRKIQTQMAIGALIGEKMRYIGRGAGMLIGGIRFLSIALYAVACLDIYRSYKRHLAKTKRIFDIEYESEAFGCNHLQIASLLVQSLGFCMPESPASMSLGIDALQVAPEHIPDKMREHLLSWKAAMLLIESYHSSGSPPETMNLEYNLFLPKDEEMNIKEKIWIILRDEDHFDWIAKRKCELPKEVAEKLEISLETEEESEEIEEIGIWDQMKAMGKA